MRPAVKPGHVPGRLAVGAYFLHSGVEKWGGGDELAGGLHAMAIQAFPFLRPIPPRRFLRLLVTAELVTGVTLLAPFVPAAVAGAVLTAFSGGLVTMYLRSPTLRKPGSIWPSHAGTGTAKDVWMLGMGLGMLVDAATEERGCWRPTSLGGSAPR